MSGVYIKGMEMPVIEFEWTIRRGADGKWYAIDTNAETTDGEWHEIVPVPPHGRLIVFPCEVDDVLYEVDDPSFGVIVCKVYSVNYSRQRARLADDEELRDCVSVLVKVIEGHGIGSSYSFGMEDFGKSIFLTREEAEAALAAPTIIPAEESE